MRVAFRADASVQIGTGHVMRCLTLAEELRRQGHQCIFICRNHEGHLADLITQKGFELHLLRLREELGGGGTQELILAHSDWLGVPWQTDAKQTLEVLDHNNADWLIVDHYALDVQWEREITEAVGQIMVIDDLADREHECSVLLDQNLGRASDDYEVLVPPTCTKLIGPRYSLLRPEFTELRPDSLERRRFPQLKRILISLGGIDQSNMTGKVLEALSTSNLPIDTELDIVMGSSAPHLDKVKNQTSRLPFKAEVSVNVTDMARRMYCADLAIGAAGGTAWERCCLGLPTILLILAENQVSAAKALVDVRAAVTLEKGVAFQSVLQSTLDQLINDEYFLTEMGQSAAQVTNGKGVGKICSILQPSE